MADGARRGARVSAGRDPGSDQERVLEQDERRAFARGTVPLDRAVEAMGRGREQRRSIDDDGENAWSARDRGSQGGRRPPSADRCSRSRDRSSPGPRSSVRRVARFSCCAQQQAVRRRPSIRQRSIICAGRHTSSRRAGASAASFCHRAKCREITTSRVRDRNGPVKCRENTGLMAGQVGTVRRSRAAGSRGPASWADSTPSNVTVRRLVPRRTARS